MKQIRRRISSVLFTLPFLVFIFVLIGTASFLLAANSFEGLFSATIFDTPRGILLLVVGPLSLLIFLGILLYSIISESLHHGERNRFRLRLFLIFSLTIFAATLPQTVIICRFVGTALDTWFSSAVSESLLSADDLAKLYTAERVHTIEKVAGRFLNGLAITNFRSRPTDWMSEIRSIDAHAVSCQVYLLGSDFASAAYLPIVETGDSGQFVPRDRLGTVRNGLFTLNQGEDVFRYGQIVRYSNSIYVCAYTSLVPAGFSARLASIKAAYAQATVIDRLRPFLPLMGLWIYILFSLPSILMVVIIAWFLSARLAEPVRSLSEAAARLAGGDASQRLIPHTRDEVAEAADHLNTIAAQIETKKRPDKKAILRL